MQVTLDDSSRARYSELAVLAKAERIVDDGSNAVGDILVVDDQMGRRVTLVSPQGRTELCATDGLAARNSTGRRLPSGASVIRDLPTNCP